MNELQQVWRERIDWVQASGLTIAEASEELGVSAASVYRWKKLLAESPVPERHPAGPGKRSAGATKSPRSTLPFLAVQVRDDDRQVNPARPSDALDSSRTVLRIVLPNGVVIHVHGNLDGERLGDLVIAAGQIPSESLTALLPDNWVKNNSQHVLVHRVEESRRAANCKRDRRERRRRLATPSAGTKAPTASPAPPKTGPSKSDAAQPDATSRGP